MQNTAEKISGGKGKAVKRQRAIAPEWGEYLYLDVEFVQQLRLRGVTGAHIERALYFNKDVLDDIAVYLTT